MLSKICFILLPWKIYLPTDLEHQVWVKNSWILCWNTESGKGVPFFSHPPPPALSHVVKNIVYMCVYIPGHMSKLCPHPLPKLPLGHPLGLGLHTPTVQFTLRGTELWGRSPWKIWGHVGMLFQSLRDLKFVLERRHSSVWLHLLGSVDFLCCGKGYGWGRAIVGLRVHESPGWHQQWLVGRWEFYLRWSKIRRPLEFSKSQFKYMTFT